MKDCDHQAVRACLEADPALVSATDESSFDAPAVILACRWAEPEMVDLLLALGARVEAAPRGVTAPHYAAWGGRAENARRLVDAGAPLSTRDEEHGASPLGWAGHFGNREVAEYLTGAGAE